jgi:hypothetical protein
VPFHDRVERSRGRLVRRADDERHPIGETALLRLPLGLAEHARRQIERRDLESELGGEQRERSGSGPDVEHRRVRLRKGVAERLSPRGAFERIGHGVGLRGVVGARVLVPELADPLVKVGHQSSWGATARRWLAS